jgi:hypothetical protein
VLLVKVAPLFFISASHATGDAEGGGDGRQDGDHQLDNRFPSFLFHFPIVLMLFFEYIRHRS